jgi:hypothetical protein
MRSQYVTEIHNGFEWWQITVTAIVVLFGIQMLWALDREHEDLVERRKERRAAKKKSLLLEETMRHAIDVAVKPEKSKRRWWRRMWDWRHGTRGPIQDASDDRPETTWDTKIETGAQFVERTNPLDPDPEMIQRYMDAGDDEYEVGPTKSILTEEQAAEGKWVVLRPEPPPVRFRVRGKTLHKVDCHHVHASPHRADFDYVDVDSTFTDETVREWVDAMQIRLCGVCKPLPEREEEVDEQRSSETGAGSSG